MIIYLIRHGQIDNPKKIFYGRSLDLLLSTEGKNQIVDLAKKINTIGDRIERIYTSPLKRALDTSKILSRDLKSHPDISINQDLIDVYIPALVGQNLKLRKTIHQSGNDEYGQKYTRLGNESRSHIVKRMTDAFKTIVDNSKCNVIAIVSHGDPIRFLLYKLTHSYTKFIPPMNKLVKSDYLEKGRAFKLIVDKSVNLKEVKMI
ncbi:MAG: Alpha-ribazole-5-phosphate phosphatase [Candidatus Roizmanbacteria bacterium GW2011_GWA2_35_19]|uniref:Alpha-ribazole-5-phosphate phosphatase n=2 Tax=Candidatus Roizmaniibacteriota TaxID=1752723 RepID=A0A0G0EQB8_9BACT|nr:MAG: Alpha-ribazole-5-phosphate phosphatase [Candidatus Roizmanbacteria bacterium GW2011_GWC2_35_12]KKP69507.1 MAG: Alpha-ribazole-5-phosphate phosphatase [Candidatus Roizmanbacteria bacterium GW2011_GWA2_35_19]